MLENISLIAQSAIKIESKDGKIIYFDPFKLGESYKNDADYIFITHPHFDHFSPEDIVKIRKAETKIIAPKELEEKIKELNFKDILLVYPNKSYSVDEVDFVTIPSYNTNKDFHKREYNWVRIYSKY